MKRALFFALALAASADAFAQVAHYGLLRGRDLTPFGFLRLDMRPADSLVSRPGNWALEVELGYQNTWAQSPNVHGYLKTLQGRRALGPAEIEAIRALPGEKYLADLELGLVDFAMHRKLGPHWSAYAVASAASYSGGFLDGVIEGVHEALGFQGFGRPALQRNRFNVLLDLKGTQLLQQGAPRRGGLLDPTVGIRYAVWEQASPWNLILETAVKIPVGGTRPYLSNGNADVGVQATVQRVFSRHALYASGSVVHTRNGGVPAAHGTTRVPTGLIGYEYALDSQTNIIVQGYASRSAFDRSDTDLAGLLKTKLQGSVGIRRRIGASVVSVAFTENTGSFNNTPDVGFQLGWVYLPRGVSNRALANRLGSDPYFPRCGKLGSDPGFSEVAMWNWMPKRERARKRRARRLDSRTRRNRRYEPW